MAEKGEKRDPKSHRTPTQIRRQVKGYNAQPEQVRRRSESNKARRKLMAEGKVKKGDGKDVAHKKALSAGGTNARSNLSVQSQAKNRGWRKGGKSKP
jgi:hypothetical protein